MNEIVTGQTVLLKRRLRLGLNWISGKLQHEDNVTNWLELSESAPAASKLAVNMTKLLLSLDRCRVVSWNSKSRNCMVTYEYYWTSTYPHIIEP